MSTPPPFVNDSHPAAPFTCAVPDPSLLPVLIAVPHAGRAYPPALRRRMRAPQTAMLRLEDRYADRLAHDVAARTGAGLIVAQAPRALIDLNRSPDDVDWAMIRGASRGTSGRRALSGLGLIPRRLPGTGELWREPFGADELAERIAGVHAPYHAALADALAAIRARWGAALLLDLHSMPPLVPRPGQGPTGYVLGDRFGASCPGRISAAGIAVLARTGRGVAHNRPYAGGYVLERHGDPQRGVHALQIEIDRSRYLDSQLAEPGQGWADTVEELTGLVRCLADEVGQIARNPAAEAAE